MTTKFFAADYQNSVVRNRPVYSEYQVIDPKLIMPGMYTIHNYKLKTSVQIVVIGEPERNRVHYKVRGKEEVYELHLAAVGVVSYYSGMWEMNFYLTFGWD